MAAKDATQVGIAWEILIRNHFTVSNSRDQLFSAFG